METKKRIESLVKRLILIYGIEHFGKFLFWLVKEEAIVAKNVGRAKGKIDDLLDLSISFHNMGLELKESEYDDAQDAKLKELCNSTVKYFKPRMDDYEIAEAYNMYKNLIKA